MTTLPVAASTEAATSPAPGSSGRILGLDLARGIAVLGMITAHVAYTSDDFTEVAGWLGLSHGRSSILFALLAGVSLGIMTGRTQPYSGVAGLQVRLRVFTRSALLLVMGTCLSILATPVAIILAYYAVWFVAALPFVRWSARKLIIAGALWAVLGAIALTYLMDLLWGLGLGMGGDANDMVFETMTGMYPGLMWMGFVLVGLGISKFDLGRVDVAQRVAAAGALAALIGYTAAYLATEHIAGSGSVGRGDLWGFKSSWTDWKMDFVPDEGGSQFAWTDPAMLLGAEPHSSTPIEAIAAGGVAVAILGLCLCLRGWMVRLLTPISSVGAMSLTAYSGHIVAIYVWDDYFMDYTFSGSLEAQTPYLVMIGSVVVFCTLWLRFFGRGPLEALIRRISLKAARASSG